MKRIANHFGFTIEQVTAAFCSLSPNNDYKGNLRSLVTVLKGINEGVPPHLIRVSTYNACKNRAINFIRNGNFDRHYNDKRTGKKILSFYRNIINPLDPEPVTIDGHAYSIWVYRRMTMKESVRTKFSYEEVAQGYRDLAAEVGLLPNQLQGVLWFTWKRIHNVVYSPQLRLFIRSDNWRLLLNPSEIKPFPFYQPIQGELLLDASMQLQLYGSA